MVTHDGLPRAFRLANGIEVEVERTAADTGGEYVEGVLRIPPDVDGPPLHWHPTATETFTVEEGTLLVETLAGTERLHPGESFTVPPGMPHRFDGGPSGAVVGSRVEPPAGVHEFLVSEAAIGQAGHLDARTPQALLRVAVWLDEHRGYTRPPGLGDRLFPLLARLGRALGYTADYQYTPAVHVETERTGKPDL